MEEYDKTMEAHNRTLHFILCNSNNFSYVEYWHGGYQQSYPIFEQWMNKIKERLNKKYIMSKYSRYYEMLSKVQDKSVGDDEEFWDEFEEEKYKVYKMLQDLYQVLNYQASGSLIDYQSIFIDNIINPLLFDQELKNMDIKMYI